MQTLTKAELLSIARKQIFDEYIERAKQLDGWMERSEKAWKEEGIKIPYPSFPIYPFDGEVEQRAALLKEKLSGSQQPIDNIKVEEKNEEVKIQEFVEEVSEEVKSESENTIPVYYKRSKPKWRK